MALYSYKCEKCGHAQDHRHGMSEASPPCPKCQAVEYKKQIVPSNFVLKGTGWYQTDFKGKR